MSFRRRMAAGFVLAAAGGFGAVAVVRSVSADRQEAFDLARAATEHAIAEAVAADAAVWAPAPLDDARAALRLALAEERAQLASLRPLPDFTVALVHLTRAGETAREAAGTAQRLRLESLSAAEAALDEVRDLLGRYGGLAPSLGGDGRRSAARARLALDRAARSFAGGDFSAALAEASEARREAGILASLASAQGGRYADDAQVRAWRQWASETIAWSRREGRPAIVVSKADRRLTLYVNGRAARHYEVELSDNWVVDKTHAGDRAVPEGRYRVTTKKDRGQSQYHRALLLDYPNESDRRAFVDAKRAGRLTAGARIGGLIEIHGDGGRQQDWTNGCVALRNGDMDHLFARVPAGTPVTIIGADGARSIEDLVRVSSGGAS